MNQKNLLKVAHDDKIGYYITGSLTPGNDYCCKCPLCGETITFAAIETGEQKFAAIECQSDGCKAKVRYMAPKPADNDKGDSNEDKEDEIGAQEGDTTPWPPRKEKDLRAGVITWGPWFWPRRHSFALPHGRTVIGRKMPDSTCNLQIADPYVSTQSAVIEVKKTEKGNAFELEVLNVSNDVLVNGQKCPTGTRKWLHEGDIITIGKTKLRFKLVKPSK